MEVGRGGVSLWFQTPPTSACCSNITIFSKVPCALKYLAAARPHGPAPIIATLFTSKAIVGEDIALPKRRANVRDRNCMSEEDEGSEQRDSLDKRRVRTIRDNASSIDVRMLHVLIPSLATGTGRLACCRAFTGGPATRVPSSQPWSLFIRELQPSSNTAII